MHRFLFFIFAVVLSSFSVEANTLGAVPVVRIEEFSVGKSWTWDYFDPKGQVYSTERYTVVAQTGAHLTIEMASDYSGGQNFKSHHRMLVDLNSCLLAYKNPVQKKPWRFQLFYFNRGQWVEIDPPNTLAFEEKFNCNPHTYSKPSEPYLTVTDLVDGTPVFMQKLWRRIEGTWFGLDGRVAAIAVAKSFNGSPGEVYKMKLRPQTSL